MSQEISASYVFPGSCCWGVRVAGAVMRTQDCSRSCTIFSSSVPCSSQSNPLTQLFSSHVSDEEVAFGRSS